MDMVRYRAHEYAHGTYHRAFKKLDSLFIFVTTGDIYKLVDLFSRLVSNNKIIYYGQFQVQVQELSIVFFQVTRLFHSSALHRHFEGLNRDFQCNRFSIRWHCIKPTQIIPTILAILRE